MGAALAAAVRALATGGLVVYPTDTLYALGASARDRTAVARLVAAKGRPRGMPISIAVSSIEEIEPLAELSPKARRFVRTHLPGPFTVLARPSASARRAFADEIAGARRTIGLRVPDHPIARELARRAGPVIATSANRHGTSPCPSIAAVRRTFGPAVAVYVAGGPRPSGRPSALVDLTGTEPRPLARR
ncbi:MAG TPA: L-threonylcarbamoyladenylate synthase [Thermoplasmata archaeon]|nr:L-threonylcarbamoyladenylate synthase [Thermoplasmata archaeon]